MKSKSTVSLILGLATISIILISNGVVSYAQTNSTMAMSNSTNSTKVNNETSTSSDNPIVKSIDDAIKAIKNGDKDSGMRLELKKRSLFREFRASKPTCYIAIGYIRCVC